MGTAFWKTRPVYWKIFFNFSHCRFWKYSCFGFLQYSWMWRKAKKNQFRKSTDWLCQMSSWIKNRRMLNWTIFLSTRRMYLQVFLLYISFFNHILVSRFFKKRVLENKIAIFSVNMFVMDLQIVAMDLTKKIVSNTLVFTLLKKDSN